MWGAEYRHTTCEVCGKGFMDDCGDVFCSSYCERQYEREHEECEICGREVGEDGLEKGICENCYEEEE
jgi:hypothetical protein